MEQTTRQQSLSNDLESALTGLVKLLKSLKFYPPQHPARTTSSVDAGTAFQPLLADHETQPYHVTQSGFLLAGEPLAPQNNSLAELARHLIERKVRHLLFLPGLSNQELMIFAEELSRPAAETIAAGGLPKQLADRQVRNIWINETNLEEILAKIEDQPEPLPEAPLPDQIQAAQDTGIENQLFPPEEDLPVDRMRDLLEQLKEPLGDREHQQLLALLQQNAPQFLRQTGLPGSLAIFSLLLNHQRDKKRRKVQRQAAADATRQLLSAASKQQLADAVADQRIKNSQRKVLGRVLAGLEMNIAPQLLGNLYAERDALIRRQYTAILAQMGETLYELLEKALADDTWHVVRNAVTVLGEIRLESALPLLETAMSHPETRVRRALIQSLSSIGGNQVIPLLTRLCNDPAEELHLPAIMALGSLGTPQAIPPLTSLLKQFDPFGKKTELKIEVIRALTSLNSPQAIVPLLKVARRTNLLRRNSLEALRAEAILALGQLGNSQLIPILDRLPKSNKGPVSRAVKQATSQLSKQSDVTSSA